MEDNCAVFSEHGEHSSSLSLPSLFLDHLVKFHCVEQEYDSLFHPSFANQNKLILRLLRSSSHPL